LLNGYSLVESVRRGSIAGALVASQLACSEAMPRLQDLESAAKNAAHFPRGVRL
jgi:sugar/nucleoside kinase (ribokinase family)